MSRRVGGGLFAGLCLLSAGSALGGAILQEGSAWRYYKGFSSPPSMWAEVNFDDSGWGGPAPSGFGYGDDDDATVLGDMQNGYVSLFTRCRFVIADTSTVTHLTLAADFDDGFVAILNGQEVARRMMPTGIVTHTTQALGNHESSRAGQNEYIADLEQNEKTFITLDPTVLVTGTNVLAVSGHNISLGSSDFSLIVELYTNLTLVRGPLLQMPQQGRMTVTWQTDAEANGAVEFGSDLTYGGGAVGDTNRVRRHVLDLPWFPPGSNVFYRVWSDGVPLATGQFRSPPAPDQAFAFGVIGDFGSTAASTRQVADQVAAGNPDFTLTVGDNVYATGQPGSFDEQWFHPYSNVIGRSAMMPLLGNHDTYSASGEWVRLYFELPTNGPAGLEEFNYSFNHGNAHFVGIDSNPFDRGETAKQSAIVSWLSNDLAQATQTWKFAYFHHPPYTSPGSHGDHAEMKAQVVPILEQGGVHMVFQGHNHFYERINPINGVHYITSGGGGKSLYGIPEPREFAATDVTDTYSAVLVEVDGPRLALRCVDQSGAVRDRLQYDLDHPFLLDGLIDDTNWVRAVNGLRLSAAIRGYHLYLATQDAGEGSDHFIYVANLLTNSRPANWAKSGQTMQWGAFLADENGGAGSRAGFCGWFNAQEQLITDAATARGVTSGLNNNAPYGNGVLEGTLQLVQHLGVFPAQLYLAAAPFGTANGGALITAAQVPAGNGNGNIEANEFLAVDTRALALDLPVAEAGVGGVAEAGQWVALDAAASLAPSGLPLSYVWTQVEGPAGVISNGNAAQATFRLAENVAAITGVVLRVTVHDTRFDTNDVVSWSFLPMLDSDGDGLSDQEELTGQDNALTVADPAGQLTLPGEADSDDDGMNDGNEALAGTDANSATSVLAIVGFELQAGTNFALQWPSASGRYYRVAQRTNLWDAPQPVVSNIPADVPLNTQTVLVEQTPAFFSIGVE